MSCNEHRNREWRKTLSTCEIAENKELQYATQKCFKAKPHSKGGGEEWNH